MGVEDSTARRHRAGRVAAVGAAVLVLGVGGWSAASAAPPLPLPLPSLPLPAPGQTYVTPDDLHGFDAEITGEGTQDFTDELGAPPAGGMDALKIATPGGGDKVQFFTSELAGPLENFESSSYYAKRDVASTANDAQFPSFQITVDKNGGAFETGDFSTLSFEPVYQSGANSNQTAGTWNKYDTGIGLFCSSRPIGGYEANQTRCDNQGFRTLSEIVEENEGITVLSAGINQGSGNAGLTSAVDLVQVGATTYNFERTAPVTPPTPGEPPNCEPPKDEHPDEWGQDEHPKGDHPKGEHGKGEGGKGEHGKGGGEHPKGEHPGDEHPQDEHPTDECGTS
ncbi:hypothetical protein [Pseudonocardia sp. KRD291]|uniref:hypothetical protein n=1 Tax=Pseudonocardia sp. KRD291 TaxID=2792007 RepID=UPI001C4A0DE3|nr:hypothetical protein [Pseudonocardia sp. KRD291]MBW0104094.1 hypothetical protein [Pseudonocardia sp. KRD291]